MNKKVILIMILSVCFIDIASLSAQNNLKLKLDNRQKKSIGEYYTDKNYGRQLFYIGYSRATFYNPTFYNNIKDGSIKPGNNIELGTSINLYPVMIDLSGFSGEYYLENYSGSMYGQTSTSIVGINFFLNIFPFPDLGGFNRFFDPYIGFGYSTSSLEVLDTNSSSTEPLGSLDISTFAWKVGLMSKFSRNLFLKAEYRQGLSLSNPKSYNIWFVGFGIGF